MTMPTRTKWIAEILKMWRGLEDDQMADGDNPESLAQRRYLVVEHGRDCSRRWFSAFDEIEEVLTFAAAQACEDEWAFTAAYDLETGEELELEFHAQLLGRRPIPDSMDLGVNAEISGQVVIPRGAQTDPATDRTAITPEAAGSATEHIAAASDALRRIFDSLYLDMDASGDFYNPDKAWDADTLESIAEVVGPFFAHLLQGGDARARPSDLEQHPLMEKAHT